MQLAQKQILFWIIMVALTVAVIGLLKDIMLPFVAGMGVAYFLSPSVDRLQAMGLSRVVGTALVIGFVTVLLGVALVFVVPLLIDQLRQFIAAVPELAASFKVSVESIGRNILGDRYATVQASLDRVIQDAQNGWPTSITAILTTVWSQGLALVNFLSLLLVTPIVVFYLLVDWHPMLDRIDHWLPRDSAPTIRRLAAEINDAIAAFVRGQGTICILLGIFYGIGLSLTGIKYGLLVGIATGVLGFIPIIGWTLGLLVASGLAIAQFWPNFVPLLYVIAVLVAGMALDVAFLSPRYVGQKVGLHPVWVIFALFVFSYLFGIVGTLVAVPVAAAVGVLVRFAVSVYLDSTVYKGRGAKPAAGGDIGP